MFRNRKNSQKPSDGLYKDFRASFPGLRQELASTQPGQASLSEAIDDSALGLHSYQDHNAVPAPQADPSKDAEPTPRANVDAWGFSGSGLTPSLLDPNSTSFNAFANQMPGYYTPTPGGNSTLYHSQQAGDLHTPGFQYGLGTPLSMPTSEPTMHAGQAAMANMPGFAHAQQMSHSLPNHSQFQHMNPYHLQQPFHPHAFQAPQPGFHQLDSHSSESPSMADVQMDMGMQQSPELVFHPDSFRHHASPAKFPHPLSEKFRFHATLNAPTAMVKHEDEIPITYLNKGQTYTLNVLDTAPLHSTVGQLRYRTFVRISFEDPDQRKKPAACWQLWKEGRGSNEAHHRGGRLQAVEFVDPTPGGNSDPRKTRFELESSSFDGFCVTWTPAPGGQIEGPIPVRFNFLSTDFSHSKGVKGIPVRLCAKTELLLDSMSPNQKPSHEVCYCKVKLFRDHGAERKLSNDVSHVKKSIEKVNQQIAQMEAGMRDLGKRKRSSAGQESQRPGKIPKHRRTWSTSSANSPGKTTAEDELHMKLAILQEMFSSTRPSSILFLRGAVEDDPDLHPVRLTGEAELVKQESHDSGMWEGQSVQSSTMVSPTPSSRSTKSLQRQDSLAQQVLPAQKVESPELKQQKQQQRAPPVQHQPVRRPVATNNISERNTNPQNLLSPEDQQQPIKVKTVSSTGNMSNAWIESLGVDASYIPPADRVIKPVASFHLQPRVEGVDSDGYYRTIYLMKRSLKDFVTAICMKIDVEPTQVLRTIRITPQGLSVLVDDADIVEMQEGQDMVAEFARLDESMSSTAFEHHWNSGFADIQVDGELPSVQENPSTGYELKLFF